MGHPCHAHAVRTLCGLVHRRCTALATGRGRRTRLDHLPAHGALYLVSETMGQVVEPLVFGHGTGVSPIAVIISTVFWTWLWGPLGLLLAMPLTVCLVVLGRHVEGLNFFEVLLGDKPALTPQQSFFNGRSRAIQRKPLTRPSLPLRMSRSRTTSMTWPQGFAARRARFRARCPR